MCAVPVATIQYYNIKRFFTKMELSHRQRNAARCRRTRPGVRKDASVCLPAVRPTDGFADRQNRLIRLLTETIRSPAGGGHRATQFDNAAATRYMYIMMSISEKTR